MWVLGRFMAFLSVFWCILGKTGQKQAFWRGLWKNGPEVLLGKAFLRMGVLCDFYACKAKYKRASVTFI